MTLRAKLTLGSVGLATILVSGISAVDLGKLMRLQFKATYERADLIKTAATDAAIDALNRQPTVNLKEAAKDSALNAQFVKLLTSYRPIVDISLVSAESNEILASAQPHDASAATPVAYPRNPDFAPLALQASWFEQLRVLLRKEPQLYKLEEAVGPGGVTQLYVRVLVTPSLIGRTLLPSFVDSAELAAIMIAVAVFVTLLASTFAFRPLGRISRMLDLVARGEYESEKAAASDLSNDEFGVIASKVGLLGQRLRGAQDEASGLRGNIDRLLADLEDAVFLFNRDRQLVFASGSVGKFLPGDRGALTGKPLAELFPPSETLGDLLDHAITTGNSIRSRRVPLPAIAAATAAARPGGEDGSLPAPPVVLLSVDILERSGCLVRLRDPEAQRKLNRQLQTADRLAAISRISGGVAHEVKNPLNAILLHVEVARAKLARGETGVAPELEIIAGEILRLDRVVRTFLDFSRPVELKLENMPVQDLVGEIVDLARPQAGASGIRIDVRQDADSAEVRVDRDLIKQAVLNVVVNAMQAMPRGGDLRFESSVSGDTAEIRVSDTGAGIPPELRDKIFRLYFSTKEKGSGIGLAMTFRIVQLHDGTIDFTSEPGKGTTFLIRLPIAV